MRRTTGATLLEQARLFLHLLTHSPESAVRHHAGELRSYLQFLHERAEITHSVGGRLTGRAFPPPDDLLPGSPADPWGHRLIASRKLVTGLLSDLAQRRIKCAVRAD